METSWSPATEGRSLAYALTLTNLSDDPVTGFRLCVSGPARIDPAAVVEGGTLVERLSNHAEFAPPKGFVLAPNAAWTVTARGLSYPLRHWTDGATGAYLSFADGTTLPVAVAPTRALDDDAPLKRGAELYAVPPKAPAPISVVPWPRDVTVSGRGAVPPGLALQPTGDEATAAAEAFGDLVQALFPVEGIVRPAAEGGYPVALSLGGDFAPEAYAIRFRSWRRNSEGRHAHRTALRADHARADPARSQTPSGNLPVPGERRNRRRACAWLARHASRRRAPVLRLGGDRPLPAHSRLEQAEPLSLAPVR